ncbi:MULTISPECIES: hypothetical protein [Priestia]|uniref:hypothetical protein n=1 Tax=Priestia TaxID=2800373 RepID=UPI00064E2959|nr:MULTISPECIES: hypothetical protein [Priestia]MCJ7987920.1 hypothetical protein [Priestia sp. OVL9]AWD68603.1 hypothetical protein C2I28_26585 [Priestia megaterium]KML24466.1 hypothetical protein VL11_25770 [Priestia aryabhattai]KMN98232.1 hypothetical protein ABV89_18755 [Priestia aryabhattai]MCJ7988036.1 hypothetical protein [Priestia sp. OVL9]
MKYVDVITESKIRGISLALLLIFMSLGWYLNSSVWYEAAILVVSIAFILHAVNYYLTTRNKATGITAIAASSGFGLYNLLSIFF